MLLIPAIDISEGRCVRLYQGDFSKETPYAPSPATLLGRYEVWGASYVHVVDLDGARYGVRSQQALISNLAGRTSLCLQVGGGVRSAADIRLLLNTGVSRVVVGSAALERPQDAVHWLQEFGADRICLAFDVRTAGAHAPQVHTHGWKSAPGVTLWDALAPYSRQALHILCTDIARDGTLFGPNVDLYREAVLRFPQFHWQASGGIRNLGDLQALKDAGLRAAISGKALLEERITVKELKPFLPDASFPASTSATLR